MAVIRILNFFFVAHTVKVSDGFQAPRKAAESEQVCLGSVCGRRGTNFMRENEDERLSIVAEYEYAGRRPFCESYRSSASRLVLLPFVPPYHGSTALASVLMSSRNLGTLCTADSWHCDGGGIFPIGTVSKTNKWLERFSHHWDLKKKVLLAPHPDIKMEMTGIVDELQNGGPPPSMRKIGVDRVYLLSLILWRPVCMGVLSGSTWNDSVEYARQELILMEQQVAFHKAMRLANQSVFVMSLSDLLWDPVWSKSRMEKMMPCLGELDFGATPELHYDHHPRNEFKFDTSVLEFGRANPASQCDYDLEKRSCGPRHNAFLRLPHDEQMRGKAAHHYLDKWSQ